MGNKNTETAPLSVRIPARIKREMLNETERLGTDITKVVCAILDAYTQCRRQHGDRMPWPPQFNYFPAGCETRQEELNRFLERSEDYIAEPPTGLSVYKDGPVHRGKTIRSGHLFEVHTFCARIEKHVVMIFRSESAAQFATPVACDHIGAEKCAYHQDGPCPIQPPER